MTQTYLKIKDKNTSALESEYKKWKKNIFVFKEKNLT